MVFIIDITIFFWKI